MGERPYEILLVEDNEINKFVTTETLNTLGHNVQTADDCLKGVSEANKRAYDLILMDIRMPNMDGIAATAKIRGESVYNKATPIYALTAHANHQDRERFQKEGMNECILKPISKSIIKDILAEIEVSTVHFPKIWFETSDFSRKRSHCTPQALYTTEPFDFSRRRFSPKGWVNFSASDPLVFWIAFAI